MFYQGHLATFRDIFWLTQLGGTGCYWFWWVGARDSAQPPTTHRTVPTPYFLSPNANSAKVEGPCPNSTTACKATIISFLSVNTRNRVSKSFKYLLVWGRGRAHTWCLASTQHLPQDQGEDDYTKVQTSVLVITL